MHDVDVFSLPPIGKCYLCGSEYSMRSGHDCSPVNEPRMCNDAGELLPHHVFVAMTEKANELGDLRDFGYEAYKYFKNKITKEEFLKSLVQGYIIYKKKLFRIKVIRYKNAYIDAVLPDQIDGLSPYGKYTSISTEPGEVNLLRDGVNFFLTKEKAIEKLAKIFAKKFRLACKNIGKYRIEDYLST